MTTALEKPRRRWLRFSLRSLLLLIAVVAVSLGWLIHKARQEGIAVAALKEMGCDVTYGNNNAHQGSPTVLERLRKLLGESESRNVTKVIGSKSQITDAGMVHVQGLTQLQTLWLNDTQVADAGLAHLVGLTQLQYLWLNDTQITDAGLVNLRGLTQLHSLVLSYAKVTDTGLACLGGLTELEYLCIDGTQVTDAGLEHLQGLSRLKYLDLTATQVTDAEVQQLQKALPNCIIFRSHDRPRQTPSPLAPL